MTSLADGFGTDEFFALPARREELAQVQAFNEANPGYWLLTHGHPPAPDDASKAFDARPPADMTYREHLWLLVRRCSDGRLAGHVKIATDLLAAGVWHLGFFMVATPLHGGGFAQRLYFAYEDWARGHGARWSRLGVIALNERAHAFWLRQGYIEARRADGYALGDRSHTLITMVKPLAGALDEYLAAVPRDRRESA